MRLQTRGSRAKRIEIFLRSDGNPSVTSFLDERRVVRGNHESWLVSTRSHSIRKPRERVHVSLTSEGNKEDSERHGSTVGSRQTRLDQP